MNQDSSKFNNAKVSSFTVLHVSIYGELLLYYRRLKIIGGALLGDCMPQIINIVLKYGGIFSWASGYELGRLSSLHDLLLLLY